MLCSSCERSLDEYVEQMLDARTRARVEAHLAECGPCLALADRLRSLTVFLSEPPELEPVPNLTFRTMAELRSLPPPRAARLPMLRVTATYLIFAWSIIAALFLLDAAHARELLEFLAAGGVRLHGAGLALGHAAGHLFGGATPNVAAAVGVILFLDGALLAAIAVVIGLVRPRAAARAQVGR